MEMFIYSDKTFRVLDLSNGQTKHLFSFRSEPEEDDFTAFRYFPTHRKLVLGKTNGQLAVYSAQSGERETFLKGSHEGAVTFIEFDDFNKLYVTVGGDAKVMVQRASDGVLLRELRGCFSGGEVSCV